jgi:hypothetical protein
MRRPVLGSAKRAIAFGVTALLILGGGAYALAKSSGGTITVCVSHKGGALYKAKKCAKHDKKLRWNARGPAGPKGSTGARGAQGAQGAPGSIGPQGPGGTMLTYDNTASATPTPTTLGTVLGDTISAECAIPATGEAETIVRIKTSDGSLGWDYDFILDSGGTITQDSNAINVAAGTYTTPTAIDTRTATALHTSNGQLEIDQIGPSPGYMVWHEVAVASTTQTCHLSVMAFPTTITSTSTKPGVRAAVLTHRPIDLTAPRH